MKTRVGIALALLLALPLQARPGTPSPPALQAISNGFWGGLADADCGKAPPRWRSHYGDVPKRLRSPREDRLRADFATRALELRVGMFGWIVLAHSGPVIAGTRPMPRRIRGDWANRSAAPAGMMPHAGSVATSACMASRLRRRIPADYRCRSTRSLPEPACARSS